jgi:TorA maturation chaperone TorD
MEPEQDAMTVAFGKLAQVAASRGELFRTLAEGFWDPTPELVQGLVDGSWPAHLKDSLAWLGEDQAVFGGAVGLFDEAARLAQGSTPADFLQQLKITYASLFLGPPKPLVQPYESLYRDFGEPGEAVLFVGPSALAVEKAYRDAGLALSPDVREPPDHIATEFEFLYYLCQQEIQGWQNADPVAARNWRQTERQFIEEHLLQWARPFFQEVSRLSDSVFYRGLAELGRVTVEMEGGAFRPA